MTSTEAGRQLKVDHCTEAANNKTSQVLDVSVYNLTMIYYLCDPNKNCPFINHDIPRQKWQFCLKRLKWKYKLKDITIWIKRTFQQWYVPFSVVTIPMQLARGKRRNVFNLFLETMKIYLISSNKKKLQNRNKNRWTVLKTFYRWEQRKPPLFNLHLTNL